MALDALRSDPSCWNSLPEWCHSDKECVLLLLSTSPVLPEKSDLERRFPQSLRFDRDVVLAFCRRPDFAALFEQRHLFVPQCLTSDKEVMLAYCRLIPRALQDCDEALADDRDVVLAAVQRDGRELQYASVRLRCDADLLRTACHNNGRALDFCPPGPVRDQLLSDRVFLLQAIQHGLRWKCCPTFLQMDRAFLLDALERQADVYLQLPKPLQMDWDVAVAAITSPNASHSVHVRALAQLPKLKTDETAVIAMARGGNVEFVNKLFTENKTEYMHKKQVVLAFLETDPTLFQQVSQELRRDPDVIIQAMAQATVMNIMVSVTREMQQLHPEIVVKAISVASKSDLSTLATYIRSNEVWMVRNVAVAWIRRGGLVLTEFASLLITDQEFCLEVAEHSWKEFARVTPSLRNNRDFMLQAIQRNGRVLGFASQAMKQDMDVVVQAVAQTSAALRSSRNTHPTVSASALKEYINKKLALHSTYIHIFLAGIAISKPNLPPAHRSSLTLLDKGVETSQAFKKMIALFLGVPMGKELAMIRKAAHNLANPAPYDDDDSWSRPPGARRRNLWGLGRPRHWNRHGDDNANEDDDDMAMMMMMEMDDPFARPPPGMMMMEEVMNMRERVGRARRAVAVAAGNLDDAVPPVAVDDANPAAAADNLNVRNHRAMIDRQIRRFRLLRQDAQPPPPPQEQQQQPVAAAAAAAAEDHHLEEVVQRLADMDTAVAQPALPVLDDDDADDDIEEEIFFNVMEAPVALAQNEQQPWVFPF
jgi:hypothetical protein